MTKKQADSGSKMSAKGRSIRAKRRASGIDKVAEKAAKGEPHAERAYVRLGTTNTNILTGQEDLSEWTEEELLRGQKRDRNGRFQGRKPVVVPTPIHEELSRRTLREGRELLRTALIPGLAYLSELVKDPEAKDADKVKAVSIILDRMMGKVPDKLEVKGDGDQPAFVGAIVNALVPVETVEDIEDVDEAELVEDDDE